MYSDIHIWTNDVNVLLLVKMPTYMGDNCYKAYYGVIFKTKGHEKRNTYLLCFIKSIRTISTYREAQ